MRYTYQVFLGQSNRDIEDVRQTLSVFPSILRLDEECFESLAGPTRNIRAYVEVSGNFTLTEEQQAVLATLGLSMDVHAFSVYWEPGELEALQEQRRREERARWKEQIISLYPDARYYLCYFRQQQDPFFGAGEGSITVQFVHPQSFPFGEYEQARQRAKELEQERYEQHDFNLQVEARLARSAEEALAGRFLDD